MSVSLSVVKSRVCRSAALLAAVLVLAGCAGKPQRVPEPASEPVQGTGVGDPGSARVESGPPAAPVTDERTARAALEQQGMVIRFDYDSAQIGAGYVDLIAAHARHATRFPAVTLRLEGHTDERGTREYNIGLGERRAQAVRRALELQGVPQSRISTVSYGEERPAVPGSGEGSWAENRRVEIRYLP